VIESWLKLSSKILGDYRVFQLRQDRSLSPRTGKEHDFYVLDTGDWINVVPLTREGKIVLIRQYRHGTEEVTLEIPGGMVDAADSSPRDSAERELLEETGYSADTFLHIGTVTPNPAILNNRCHTYLAINARPVGPPQLDGSEDIEFELIDQDTIPQLVESGQITHALVIAAFYFFEQYKDDPPGTGTG
jgi:8-oxo-dGTP pyrophosphatase MutT (NUDIX family)